MSRPTSPWGVGGLVNFVFSLPKPPLSSRSSANSISSSTSSGSSTGSSSATNRISGSSNTCTLRYQNISQFTVVACAVSLCASLPPVSRQLSSWASLLVGLVGMREASGPRSSSSSSTYSKSEPGPTCSKSGPGPTTQSLTRHPRIQRVSLGQPYKSAQKRSRVTSAAYSAYGVASPVAAFISCSSMSLSSSYTTSAPGT